MISRNFKKVNRNSLFGKDWLAMVSLLFLLLLFCCSFLSEFLTAFDPNAHGDLIESRYLPISFEHPFGTDKFGRDVFSRVLYGGRISLSIAICVSIFSAALGLAYGAIAGYLGGACDRVMMWLLDFLLAFPVIFLILPAVAIFDMNHWYLIPLLTLTGWMETARIIRAEVLSLKERDFVLAAIGMGFSHSHVLRHHVIPNCLTPILVIIPLKIAETILLESGLSFLGVGVQPPVASWGNIIHDGRDVLHTAWWVSAFPGLLLAMTVLSFNFIGEALRKRFSVRA